MQESLGILSESSEHGRLGSAKQPPAAGGARFKLMIKEFHLGRVGGCGAQLLSHLGLHRDSEAGKQETFKGHP